MSKEFLFEVLGSLSDPTHHVTVIPNQIYGVSVGLSLLNVQMLPA